jgi:DNA-binding response OmpR family regulator/DNA-binding CsgD family transcriptional regulator
MARVLVVDDEPDIVLFVQVNLELHGHEVRTAADGEQALAAVEEERPDALVLDVMMPNLDGWTVLERLKAHQDESLRTIPVVMLTALDTDHDQARGGIEGAVRYLTKPLGPDELVTAVEEVLSGPPEPEQRKAAQQKGLASLARIERNDAGGDAPSGPRTRLSRLEHTRTAVPAPAAPAPVVPDVDGELTDKQRELLRALRDAESVSAAADALGMSRSNVYASLRRIGRKLGISDVSELLRLLRDGALTRALEG